MELNFDALIDKIERSRYGTPKIGNNTIVFKRYPNKVQRSVAIQYHKTVIAFITEIGRGVFTVEINSGGWHTITTKTRINEILAAFNTGAYVRQENYAWYLHSRDGVVQAFADSTVHLGAQD